MSTITQVISDISPAADPYTMDIPTFSSTAAQNVTDIVDMTAELNTWAGQVNTVKGEMVTDAATATTQAGIATTQAGIATTQASNAAASALTAINAPGTNATSTTSDTIASGSTTITIQTGKAFVVGMFVLQASTASPSNYNHGQITAYDSGTGSLTIDVLAIGGSGTFASWTVSLSSAVGGSTNLLDEQLSRAMLIDCGYTVVDKGNISSTTVTFDYTGGSIQTFTATGSTVTLATSNWPPTGNLGELLIVGTNMGAYTMSFPSWIWTLADGTTTTSVSTFLAQNGTRTAFQASGVDKILLITRDAGTTVYASLLAL